MNYSIRNAELKDLKFIVDIYNSTVHSGVVTADTEEVSSVSKLEWFASHNSKRPLWVIDSEDSVAGWLSFHSFYGRPAYEITAEIGIYIHEKFRGKQLGKKLLEKAISEAPSMELENLLGFIFSENKPSLLLFSQFGFEQWGHLPAVAKFGNHYQDLIIVGKKLNTPNNTG